MITVQKTLAACALALTATLATAATTTYTNEADFLAALAPGYYTENFTGLSNPGGTSTNFSGNGFSYTATSPGGLYLAGGFLGTNLPQTSLTLTLGSGSANALGAYFFDTNISDAFQSTQVVVHFSDGTTFSFTPSSQANSFRGAITDAAITSVVFDAPIPTGNYAGLDTLTVGKSPTFTAAPEPASLAMLGVGAVALGLARRRRGVARGATISQAA